MIRIVFGNLNKIFSATFKQKTWRKSSTFFGIEIAQFKSDVVMSQKKYVLDILEKTSMLDCKLVDTPMDPNVKLVPG